MQERYIWFFFSSLPLCLFSPHRLTSHLWISHGLADNSWSPCHAPTAFNMNYKMASQAYQWMTDWMCMAPGQRGVRAQWLPHSVNPQDWKYQCGTREGLPSAQCMALLETNVVLRRIVNLCNLLGRNTSMLVIKKNSSLSVWSWKQTGKKKSKNHTLFHIQFFSLVHKSCVCWFDYLKKKLQITLWFQSRCPCC